MKKIKCGNCGFVWFKIGENVSKYCPQCNAKFNKTGCDIFEGCKCIGGEYGEFKPKQD